MNVVSIFGEINNEMVIKTHKEIVELKKQDHPEIVVLISSCVGIVEDSFDLYDLLQTYPGKKTGIVWRHAKSMASFILQACDVRYCTSHARILIHHINKNISLDMLRNQRHLDSTISGMEKLQSMIYEVYSERSGRPIPEIKKHCAMEKYMYPDEAKKFGLIDEIWTKPLPWGPTEYSESQIRVIKRMIQSRWRVSLHRLIFVFSKY